MDFGTNPTFVVQSITQEKSITERFIALKIMLFVIASIIGTIQSELRSLLYKPVR
jgi:hypothetical protein